MKHFATLTFLSLSFLVPGCDIDKTEAGEMPDVDVDVEPGKLSEYDVDMADVDVGTTTETVTVPKAKIVMDEEEVEVSYLDVSLPEDDADVERTRQTLQASVKVRGTGAALEIREVFRMNDQLMVIATLESNDGSGEPEMVSDAVVMNAPALDVEYVSVGDRPSGELADNYRYISAREELNAELSKARRIYKR